VSGASTAPQLPSYDLRMINELLQRFWSTEVRMGPILVGIGIFALLKVLRRWSQFQYVPSYFIFYPSAALERDVSRLYGTGPFEPALTRAERRRLKRSIQGKAMFSIVISFVAIPTVVGSAAAFFMNVRELLVLIAVILIWQGYAAFQATLDNAVYAAHPRASAAFFASVYAGYLFFLSGCMWQAYRFVAPFAAAGDYGGLAASVWDGSFRFAAFVVLAGLLGNIAAHLITDQEIARPSWTLDTDPTDEGEVPGGE
jgi:hypothetical protein